jgi:hypothetical protein
MTAEGPRAPGEVTSYYASFGEASRLASGAGRLEFERTRIGASAHLLGTGS